MSTASSSLAALVLMAAAALGGGAWTLRLTGTDKFLRGSETPAIAFVLGSGILSWFAFMSALTGWLRPVIAAVLCVVLGSGLAVLRWKSPTEKRGADWPIHWTIVLGLGIGAALLFDLVEALAPPADADSLAYHFARPREFIAAGKLVFIPRASDGTSPLLQQMTYAVALALGGERTLTLWTMLSGWSAPLALYVFARRHMARNGALALALVFLTTPAVIYGAGAGHVEVRNAGFVIVAVLAAMEARRLDRPAFAAIAGLAAGFFAGSKYPGLFLLPLVGLVLIAQRRWFAHGLAYTIAALLAAAPFYGWNWWNTGDPVYPMLFGILDYRPGVPWSADIQADFRHMFQVGEKALPPTLPWALAYPFLATLAPSPVFESDRTGFGPLVLMVLPVALVGMWVHRRTLARSPLWTAVFVAAGFYVIWFLFGASQRVRHFLPIYPLLLLGIGVATERGIAAFRFLAPPTIVATVAVVALQLAIHAVFTINPARYLWSEESREAYLRRNVSAYDAAVWLNAHLGPSDRLLHTERQMAFLLPVHSFYGHYAVEPRIDLRPLAHDPGRFWDELAVEGITHLLVSPLESSGAEGGYSYLASRLAEMGCAREMTRLDVVSINSRTIAHATSFRRELIVLALDARGCPLEHGRAP